MSMILYASSADYWKAQAEAWQAEAEKDLIEIERLREHAVILAATAEQVERDRWSSAVSEMARAAASNNDLRVYELLRGLNDALYRA